MENAKQQRLKNEWNNNEALRAEFADVYEAYLAYFTDMPGITVRTFGGGGLRDTVPVTTQRLSYRGGN